MKTLMRVIPLGLALTATALNISGKSLTPDEALRYFTGQTAAKRVAAIDGKTPTLAYTSLCGNDKNRPAYYVYNKPLGGFIILSADDELSALLADVDSGSFDPATLPDNVRWWLGEYTREIDWYMTHRDSLKNTATESSPRKVILQAGKEAVEPLVKSKWSQDKPYFNQCPVTTAGEQTVTGCVATAMAQIMKYHNYPEHGISTHSYYDQGILRSFDFGNTYFNWEDMRYEYNEDEYSEEEAEAVARLMYACGISINSEYTTTATSSLSLYLIQGYRKFFGYSGKISYIQRDLYSLSDWIQMIYDEIAAGRPVNYSGVGPAGGHAFVADGFREDNLFHINWGWSGNFDGYFRLTSLNPAGVGIGGGAGAFNTYQEAIIHICPPGEDTEIEAITPVYIYGDVKVAEIVSHDDEGCVARVNFSGGGIYGNVHEEYKTTTGAYITDEAGEEIGWYPFQELSFAGMGQNGTRGYANVAMHIPRLPEGRYHIFVAVAPEGEKPQIVPVWAGYNRYINLYVDSDNKMNLTNDGATDHPDLQITDAWLPKSFHPTAEEKFTLEILSGNGDYDGYIVMEVENAESGEIEAHIPLSLKTFKYVLDIFSYSVAIDVEPGEYDIRFLNYMRTPIGNDYRIKVTPDSESGVELTQAEAGEEGAPLYYNLQGNRVHGDPAPGVYIRRQGSKTEKILISR